MTKTPLLFPPPKSAEHVNQTYDLHNQWVPMLNELVIRRRPHTTAVIPMRQNAQRRKQPVLNG